MVQITTSTSATATAYSNQRKVDRTSKPVATNLLTNPSAEVDVTGYSASNGTLSRSTVDARYGTASFQIDATAASNVNLHTRATVAAPGETFHLRMSVKNPNGTARTARIDYAFEMADGTRTGTYTALTETSLAANGPWVDMEGLTVAAPAGTERIFVVFGVLSAAVAEIFRFDGLQVVKSDTSVPYFDGNINPANGYTYYWTGTAHASTSVKAELGTGNLWAIRFEAEAPSNGTYTYYANAAVYYSLDDGATWAMPAMDWGSGQGPYILGGSASTYTPNGSFFIDENDFMHLAYKNRSDGYIMYRRGTPNTDRTAWTWSTPITIYAATDGDYPDIIAHREGTGWMAWPVWSMGSGRVARADVTITSAGAITAGSALYVSKSTAYGTLHSFPSIDFNHTGDGKTVKDGTPHLYIAWSAGTTGAGNGIRFKKAVYANGAWLWDTEREIDSARFVNGTAFWINCHFDGTRVVITGFLSEGGAYDVVLYERDAADTTTTTYVLLNNVSTSNYMMRGASTYDASGNVYLFGQTGDEGAGADDLVLRKWTRATATFGAENIINSNVGSPWISTKRGDTGNKIELVYMNGTASPYSVNYEDVNRLPDAPANVVAGTAPGTVTELPVSWTHSDPDGNPQVKYKIRWRKI